MYIQKQYKRITDHEHNVVAIHLAEVNKKGRVAQELNRHTVTIYREIWKMISYQNGNYLAN
ncbi:MAG: hypothetical protein ACQEP6_01715 [Patescibacteria group bacterium]